MRRTRSGPSHATWSSSASTHTPKGMSRSNSEPRPLSTRQPRSSPSRPSSSNKRVFPMPGSPLTATKAGVLAPSSSSARTSSADSRRRPTRPLRPALMVPLGTSSFYDHNWGPDVAGDSGRSGKSEGHNQGSPAWWGADEGGTVHLMPDPSSDSVASEAPRMSVRRPAGPEATADTATRASGDRRRSVADHAYGVPVVRES